MIRSSYEKDDVSEFRKHVRTYRFRQPVVEKQLLDLLSRMDVQEKPNVAIFKAQTLMSDHKSTGIDSTGAGKTDFTYFATEFFRQKGAFVLPFPNVGDRIHADANFYETEFIPEIYRSTISYKDKIFTSLQRILALITTVFQRSILLIQVSLWLAIGLLVFVLGTGFVALRFLVETYGSMILPYIELITPITVTVIIVIWMLLAWDRIKNNDKKHAEWKSHSLKATQEIFTSQMIKSMPTWKILKRFPKNQKGFIIIDDVEELNANSLSSLTKFAEEAFIEKDKNTYSSSIALILIIDELNLTSNRSQSSIFQHYFEEVSIRKRDWIYYELPPTSFDDVHLLLWGYFNSDIAEHVWGLVNALLREYTELRVNVGFLLQYLYYQTGTLEIDDLSVASLTEEVFIQNYEKFRKSYSPHVDDILSSILNVDYEYSCKMMLKLILAFQPLQADKVVVDTLIKNEGYDPDITFHQLMEIGLLKDTNDSYYFTNISKMNALDLSWQEWLDDSENYRTKIFLMIHDVFPKRKKDPPILAKRCLPSNLVIDCLWREADAQWFYGGEADTITALEYIGLDNGALGKWYRKLNTDANNSDISDLNFEWVPKAQNPPFKTPSSQSIRNINFIGDLTKFVASLYFIKGEFEKSRYVLEDVWKQTLQLALASSNVTNRVREKMTNANFEIQIQRAAFLLRGPISAENLNESEKICSQLIQDQNNSALIAQAKTILWNIEYLRKYGFGNLLNPLILIRESIPLTVQFPNDFSDKSLNILAINLQLFALFEFLDWAIKSNPDAVADTLASIKSALKEYRQNYGRLKQYSEKKPLSSKDPDLDIKLLTFWGKYLIFVSKLLGYSARIFFLQHERIPNRIEECGVYMLEHSRFSKQLIEDFAPSNFHIDEKFSSNRLSALPDIQKIYSQYAIAASTKTKEAKELCQNISIQSEEFAKDLQNFYIEKALKSLRLARKLSDLRFETLHETILTYQILELHLLLLNTQEYTENLRQSISWELQYIDYIEGKQHFFLYGYELESFRVHYSFAQALGEKSLNYSLYHIDKAKEIIALLDDFVPKIIGGQVRLVELQLMGNMGKFIEPNRVLKVANDAHEVYSAYQENGLNHDDLAAGKANVRWWIAEACVRLASQQTGDSKDLQKIAYQHLNWIENLSFENDTIKYLKFKSKQVRSRFLRIQGNYDEALSLLKISMQEYSPDLFEQIQVYSSIVELENEYLSTHRKSSPPEARQREIYAEVMALMHFNQNVKRQFDNKTASPMLHNISISGVRPLVRIVFETSLREDADLVQQALDLWIYSINGFIDWGIAGQAIIELRQMKIYELTLPSEFEVLLKKAFIKWDPRHELTNRNRVEQAIQELIGERKISLDIDSDIYKDKRSVIRQAYVLMAHPKPDYQEILQMIESCIPTVNLDEPDEVDINLYTLLTESYS
jgi:hypothetical protein